MNQKLLFEISHMKLLPILENIPESIKLNLRQCNGKVFQISMLQKNHPLLPSNRLVNEPLYYCYNNITYQMVTCENQQFIGDLIFVLSTIKYRGIYEIESLGLKVNLEQKKKQTQNCLKQTCFENTKENDENHIMCEIKMEDQDEYMFNYSISYKYKPISQVASINSEEQKLERRAQLSIKAILPFESHYTSISDNFPIVLMEYSCANISKQQIKFHKIDFNQEQGISLEKTSIYPDEMTLFADEVLTILFKMTVQIDDIPMLQKILTQKDTKDYLLKLGHISIQWGRFGKHLGSTKSCDIYHKPISIRLEKQQLIPRDMITKISIEVSLGIFFPNTNVELMIRLDESEMKNIKIVGLDTMVLQFRASEPTKRVSISILATHCGIQVINGLKFYDSFSQKSIPYKNNLDILVINRTQDYQQENTLVQSEQTILVQKVEEVNLLDICEGQNDVDLL